MPRARNGGLELCNSDTDRCVALPADPNIDIREANLEGGLLQLHGSARVSSNGYLRYTPNADYHGPDSFIVQVNDDMGNQESAEIVLTVTPVDDAAVFGGDTSGTGTMKRGVVTGTLTASAWLSFTSADRFWKA